MKSDQKLIFYYVSESMKLRKIKNLTLYFEDLSDTRNI